MDCDDSINHHVYDTTRPESVREAIDTIKAEHGVSETAAYAILIRSAVESPRPRTAAPLPSPDLQEPGGRGTEPTPIRVPLQRTTLGG